MKLNRNNNDVAMLNEPYNINDIKDVKARLELLGRLIDAGKIELIPEWTSLEARMVMMLSRFKYFNSKKKKEQNDLR